MRLRFTAVLALLLSPSNVAEASDEQPGKKSEVSGIRTLRLAPTSSILMERRLGAIENGRRSGGRGRRILGDEAIGDPEVDPEAKALRYRLLHPQVGAVYGGLSELGPLPGSSASSARRNSDDGGDEGDGGESPVRQRRLRPHEGAPPEEDYVEKHNRLVREFNAHRHLSRHEREYRRRLAADAYAEGGDPLSAKTNATVSLPSLGDDADAEALSSLQRSLSGGMLDVYQSAPLSQGYGTHYATVWVGSPSPQRKSVIVDTGSHYTAFPCKGCQNCGEEHHTDNNYDPDVSDTFRVVQCGHCSSSARCEGGRCAFSQSYTEGSSWKAYQATDSFFCGGSDNSAAFNEFDRSFAIDFMFGCQTSETGLFVTQLADGIMGMSAHEATLAKQMWRAGKLEHNMFTLCFRQELSVSKEGVNAGMMTLGGVDSRLNSNPMVFAKNMARNGWFTIFVKNVFLRVGGGQSVETDNPEEQHIMRIPVSEIEMNSGKGVIVDSGTTDTYLHSHIAQSFGEAWKEVTRKKYSNAAIRLSREELLRLPTVLLQIRAYAGESPDPTAPSSPEHDDGPPDGTGGVPGLVGSALDPHSPNDVLLAIPATHYMEYSPTKDVYTSRLYFTESRGGVLGANAMQGHNVLFDWENGRVGFAESTCEFTKKASGAGKGDGVRAGGLNKGEGDCLLSLPALEKRCVQSLDLKKCGAEGTDILTGTERFSFVVERGGSAGFVGVSCEEAIVKAVLGADSAGATCNGDGLCFVRRPCQMSCGEAALAANDENTHVDPAARSADQITLEADITAGTPGTTERAGADLNLSQAKCGVNLWSSCQASCMQSQTESVLTPDGLCQEDTFARRTRECHVDACGRTDPCRVPFVIHAILGLGGANPDFWDDQMEQTFAEAISDAINFSRDEESSLFTPGDVKILGAGPWYPNEYARDAVGKGPGEAKGTKLVVEVSVYNSNAALPKDDGSEDGEGTTPWAEGRTKSGNKDSTSASRVASAPALATCEESDLYPLAKRALDIHVELGRQTFIPQLLEIMRSWVEQGDSVLADAPIVPGDSIKTPMKGTDAALSFVAPLAEPYNVGQSQLVTSWTVRTSIEGKGQLHDHLLHDPRLRSKGRIKFYATSPRFWTGIILMSLSLWTLRQSFVVERISDIPKECLRPCFPERCLDGSLPRQCIEEVSQKCLQGRKLVGRRKSPGEDVFTGDDGFGDALDREDANLAPGEEIWEVQYDRVPLRRAMDRHRYKDDPNPGSREFELA